MSDGEKSKGKKEKSKKNYFCYNWIAHNLNRAYRSIVDIKNNVFLVLKDETGLFEVYILTTYLVFFLTLLAFLMGVGFGSWKQAYAKYGYMAESMSFAVEAANMTGAIGGVEENEEIAREFFEAAMDEMVGEYTLQDFYAVEEGDTFPGGTAVEPGFVVEVVVPVKNLKVPFLGNQQISVPMAYYAVTKSEQQ